MADDAPLQWPGAEAYKKSSEPKPWPGAAAFKQQATPPGDQPKIKMKLGWEEQAKKIPTLKQTSPEQPSIAQQIGKLSPDLLSNAIGGVMDKAAGAVQGGISQVLQHPLPGIAPGVGMSETGANQLSRDALIELMRRGGEVAPEAAIKSPALKTAEGVTEGPNHPAIRAQGGEGQPGFTTTAGQFVDRGQGADIAKVTGQAKPETGAALHSEDLKPGASEAVAPKDVGAAQTPKAVLDHFKAVPPVPSKEYIASEDDSFFRLRQSATADRQQVQEFLKSLPPEIRDPQVQQKLYEYIEPGAKVNLTPKEQQLYDQYVRPWKQEEAVLYREAQKIDEKAIGLQDKIDGLYQQATQVNKDGMLSAAGKKAKLADIKKQIDKARRQQNAITGMDDFDPEHVHRMVKSKTPELDPWMGEASASNPIQGYRSTTAPSMKPRKYFVMESEGGERKLIALGETGPHVLERGGSTPFPRYQGEATAPGDEFTINGTKWTIKQARTSEIESNTSTKYYKNALASAIKNTLQLRAVVRAQAELRRLKDTPEFAAYTRPITGDRPEGWRTPDMPLFRGYWMHPHLADVIDDFWGKRGQTGVLGALAAINRFAITSLFYSPVPHALNAAAHWVTARGWDNVTPMGYRSLVVDGARAIKSVVTQDKDYQRLLREGSGLIYGSVANTEFYKSMLQALGESVKREPWKWDPIAKAIGWGPSDLVRGLYNVSSRALWAASDAMMMQRVFELERKGMSVRDAIAEAEKHIPNYRIPPQVLGSRAFAQLIKDPTLTAFSRYHYGQFKSMAHMAKDLAVGTKEEKFKAVGNVFATGALMLWVWPLINQQIQKLSGDKDLELGPKGSTTIPSAVRDWWEGKKDMGQVIQGSVTLSPVIRMGVEELFNRDMFTGKSIREPYDEQQHKFGRTAAQTGEHLLGGVVAPYETAAKGVFGKDKKGAAHELLKQGLGLRKTPKVYKGRSYQGTPAQQAAFRQAHPHGKVEDFEKWLERKYQGAQ